MNMTPEQIRALMSSLQFTKDYELTCDEWLAELPGYLDATPAEQAGDAFRLVREHLDICPECREEIALVFDAVREIVGSDNFGTIPTRRRQ